MKKVPWLAELLNIIPLPMGLGYLYLGRRRAFVVTFVVAAAAVAAAVVVTTVAISRDIANSDVNPELHIGVGFFLAAIYGALLVFVLLPLAIGTALHSYRLAGGTAQAFLPQQGRLVLAFMLAVVPLALAAVLLDPANMWHYPFASRTGRSVTSSQVPATAFKLGAGFLVVLAAAVLVTWRSGGLGRLPARWWRPAWAVAGLAVGVLLILLGLDDATGFHGEEDALKLLYAGAAITVVLIIGFVGPVVSERLAGRHR